MYTTIKIYISDGRLTEFAVPMSYIKREYIKVYRQDPNTNGFFTDDLIPITYTWLNDGMLKLSQPVPSGNRVTIRRETYADAPLVDFQDAAILVEEELDLAALQALHVAQEAKDQNGSNLDDVIAFFEKLQGALEDVVAEGLVIQERLEGFIQEVKDLAAQVEAILDRAQEALDTAYESTLAAREAEYWARLWASQSPGVVVKDGLYSARHYADAAQANNGDLAGHVAAYDPHPQYLRKDEAGDGMFELDANGDLQIRLEITNPTGRFFYVDAWDDVAMFN